MERENLSVWVLTDGKIGDDVQCLAVAAGLSDRFEQRRISPRAPWSMLAPWGPIDPRDGADKPNSPIAPPFPDVVIASGRRAVPYARAVKNASGGKTLLVFMKNPRASFADLDVVWAPAHDKLEGANVFSTLTSPHGLASKIEEARKAPLQDVAKLANPMLGVVIGGVGGGARYDEKVAEDLAAKIKTAAASFASVAVTPSRRTPAYVLDAVRNALAEKQSFVWYGEGENPYADILANADALIVTADSHNMMSEAVATGTGVYAYRPPSLAPKLEWFLRALEEKGVVRALSDNAEPFSYSPINATEEIVAEIRKRIKA